MTPESLFTAALALEEGWKVERCEFAGDPQRLILKLDFDRGQRFACPQCGQLCGAHDSVSKEWRHLDFFQYECLLQARVPRVGCPEHGVLQAKVPWARSGSGFTILFEALTMLLAREMPMSAVADTLDEQDTRLWRVAQHYVEAAHAKESWLGVTRICVDETSSRRGHRYVTNIIDADKLACSIQRHWNGIVAFLKTRVTNGAIEAINGLLQLAKRSARGYRSLRNFQVMAYLKAGQLDLQIPSLRPTLLTHSK